MVSQCKPDPTPAGDVAEQRAGIAIRHAVEGAARRDAYADTIRPPDGDERLNCFAQESRPIFDRAAIPIGSLVAVVLEELVDQMPIGRHQLDAIEARFLRIAGSDTVLLDDVGDLSRFQRPVR